MLNRAGAGFEDVGEDGGQNEACRQFDEMMPEMFALERNHAEKLGGHERGVGEDERQYQKNVHGCGHDVCVFLFSDDLFASKGRLKNNVGTAYLNKNGSL